eukprot:2698094-Prymnesium_polylepis.1
MADVVHTATSTGPASGDTCRRWKKLMILQRPFVLVSSGTTAAPHDSLPSSPQFEHHARTALRACGPRAQRSAHTGRVASTYPLADGRL